MNRNLLIALTLPSLMFYQSNAPILYSSEKLIAQVKEEQAILGFDLSESGNTLIISNDQLQEGDETVNEARPPDQSEKNDPKKQTTMKSKDRKTLPKTKKQVTEESSNRKKTAALEAIEQKISALPFTELPDDKTGERELVRMLANMSGTIIYGTKMTETNREEYITF